MKPAIRVENVSKHYRIGASQTGAYRTLRESLTDATTAPIRAIRRILGKSSPLPAHPSTNFWALKDVSFEVQPGEIVGIIGRNGAGKSTLLKILSRITEPTQGKVEYRGRVASLLEVGTGFHPELTGRENIFLNGVVLGMSRREIQTKFDEIVAFADIDQFLETPVKRYSSGMYVRLAFAVAAHLEPEILLVDEVLAVGDANFQKKCLNKMEDVTREGRTILFVSHNMAAVTRLCPRTIYLSEGYKLADGPSPKIVPLYFRSDLGTVGARRWSNLATAPGNDIVRLNGVRVRDEDGRTIEAIDIRKPVAMEMEFTVLKPGHRLMPGYHFLNEEGVQIFCVGDHDPKWRRRPRPKGTYVSTAWIPGNYLAEGTLIVGAAVSTVEAVVTHFFEREAVAFQVIDTLDGDSARGDYAGHFPGVVRPLLSWETEFVPSQCD